MELVRIMEPPPKLRNAKSREILSWRIEGLSKPAYQERVWRLGIMPSADYFDSYSDAINDFYTALNDEPVAKSIGYVLFDEDEVAAVDAIVAPLNRILADNGPTSGFEKDSQHEDWPNVIAAAQHALEVLRRSDRRYARP